MCTDGLALASRYESVHLQYVMCRIRVHSTCTKKCCMEKWTERGVLACRELDHGMLRRLDKRILVDLPIKSARSAMLSHHLPPTISQHPLSITTHIDYDRAAEVSLRQLTHCLFCCELSSPKGRYTL